MCRRKKKNQEIIYKGKKMIKKRNIIGCLLGLVVMLSACTISYKFNGASIDYTKVKSISIKDFPNQAPLVYAPLAQLFTEELKDIYVRQTRLNMVRENGDLDLASQSKLTITVRVRYSNRTKPEEDFEQSFSAYREFENTQLLQDVQDQLCSEMVEEIADQIYNATVANW